MIKRILIITIVIIILVGGLWLSGIILFRWARASMVGCPEYSTGLRIGSWIIFEIPQKDKVGPNKISPCV